MKIKLEGLFHIKLRLLLFIPSKRRCKTLNPKHAKPSTCSRKETNSFPFRDFPWTIFGRIKLATSSFNLSRFFTYDGSSSESFMSQSFVRWRCGCLKSNSNDQLANKCSVVLVKKIHFLFVLDILRETPLLQWCLRDPHYKARKEGMGKNMFQGMLNPLPRTCKLQPNVSTTWARSSNI